MSEPTPEVEQVFLAALERATPAERRAYAEGACSGNPELLQRALELLGAHEESQGPLDVPLTGLGDTATVPAIRERPGTVIGPYKLLQQIGGGGMGAVFLAEQTEPVQRRVALKVIKPGMDSRQVLARFEAERQALALMDHPNIAKVLDAGTTDSGQPYFVMELVKGVPITRYCDEHRLTPRQRLGLFVPVCQAIQHAHQKGIIHRDLKPSNVLVALYDGRPVPKVIDFGVAKATGPRLTERTVYTEFGAVIGTLEYMSPEQAELNQLDIDTRSDIYSLGVLLYELLTGTTPLSRKRLKETAFFDVLRLIREEEPPRPSTRLSTAEGLPDIAANRGLEPRKLSGLVRGELDWIVMKCLEKDRSRRYETANGLAGDLERYLADEPVQACPPSAGYRFRKFARRHKAALAAGALVSVALLVAVAALAVSNVLVRHEGEQKAQALHDKEEALRKESAASEEAKEQTRVARQQSAEARRQSELARRNLYVAHLNLAQAHWENGNVSQVEEFLDLYRRPEPGQEDLRGWEWHYQERLCHAYLRALRGHGGGILGVAFSPDGTRLATGSNDGVVKVWEVATGRELRTFSGQNGPAVLTLAFSPDGTRLATDTEDGTVKLWDMASGKEIRTLRGHKGSAFPILGLAFSADGTRLAAGGSWATVWDVTSGEALCRLSRGASVAFSPDGTRLATTDSAVRGGCVGPDRDATVWDVKTGREVRTFRGHGARVTTVVFSPDGTRLASGGFDNQVRVWDVAGGQELRTLQGHSGWVESLAFSPDGTRLASGSSDQTVRVWDVAGGQGLRTFRGHNNSVTAVAFSPDGTRLASGSSDQTVKVWDVAGDPEFRTLQGKSSVVTAVVFSPDGTRLASGSYSSVTISDVASGKVIRTLPGGVNALAFSPDGTRLATGGSHDRSIRLWDVAAGKQVHVLREPSHEVRSTEQINALAFSPDGKLLASGSHHGAVKLWDAATGKELRALPGDNMVWGVAFNRDGTRLASNDGRTVKLWGVATGKEVSRLQGHEDQVVSVAFSPDGALLASGGNDRTVKLWEVASGKELRTLRGHKGGVHRVAFSPDGTRLASGSDDRTVKVWDVAGGQELRTLRHEDLVGDVAFNRDGMRLASGSGGRVRLWDATPWTEESRVEHEARGRLELLFGRPLTREEVVARLRGDATISEVVRRRALGLVEDYAASPPPP
jgi:WD40 repeat protein/serine/threonine protein kinase